MVSKNKEVVVDEVELDEMTEALIETGGADGNATSEEVAEVSSEETKDEGSDVAPAESETEDEISEEVTSDAVSEEVVSLTVTLTFDDEAVELDVTENFQLDLRKACQDRNSRFNEFEVAGDLSPENLRLLLKALK